MIALTLYFIFCSDCFPRQAFLYQYFCKCPHNDDNNPERFISDYNIMQKESVNEILPEQTQ